VAFGIAILVAVFAAVWGSGAEGTRHLAPQRGVREALVTAATAVAVSLILIASQDQPFGGPFGLKPDVLEQVIPSSR
jgi:hypothetical protein